MFILKVEGREVCIWWMSGCLSLFPRTKAALYVLSCQDFAVAFMSNVFFCFCIVLTRPQNDYLKFYPQP